MTIVSRERRRGAGRSAVTGAVEGISVGEVCAGISAASVAWHQLGWSHAWYSEIDKFASAVLAHHYPDVPNHGDFTGLRDVVRAGMADGATPDAIAAAEHVTSIDVLMGGTPCQDFSVAGLRASLAGERGNLTLEFIRLADAIDDFRRARGLRPLVIVWENVPGVLSTRDNAFGAFLGGLVGGDAALARPAVNGWTDAGVVDGPRRCAAWRCLDAQHFGLAQRRKRVFVVACGHPGGWAAPDTLLPIVESMSWHPAPSREARKDVAGSITTRAGNGSRQAGANGNITAFGGNRQSGSIDTSTALNAKGGVGRMDFETETLIAHSLRGEGFDASGDGTGRGTPLVPMLVSAFNFYCPHCEAPFHDAHATGVATLCPAECPQCGCEDGTIMHYEPLRISCACGHSFDGELDTLCPSCGEIDSGSVTYPPSRGGQPIAFNARQDPDISGAVTGPLDTDPGTQAVAWAENSRAELRIEGGDGSTTGSLKTGGGKPGQSYPVVATLAIRGRGDDSNLEYRHDGLANAMLTPNGGRAGIGCGAIQAAMTVRRLTERECARLQGFPDDYLDITYRGKPAAGGNKYKALGNSIAVPVLAWIGRKIEKADKARRDAE